MEPRDPLGPPEETFNCRCTLEVVPVSNLMHEQQLDFENVKVSRDSSVTVINMEADRRRNIIDGAPAVFEIADNPNADASAPFIEWPEKSQVFRYDGIIQGEAIRQGVDPDLVRAIMYMETTHGHLDWIPALIDVNKSLLPMNIKTETWRDLGWSREDLKDPKTNIKAGTLILKRTGERVEDPTVEKIASVYNFLGREKVNDYGARVGVIYREKLWKEDAVGE